MKNARECWCLQLHFINKWFSCTEMKPVQQLESFNSEMDHFSGTACDIPHPPNNWGAEETPPLAAPCSVQQPWPLMVCVLQLGLFLVLLLHHWAFCSRKWFLLVIIHRAVGAGPAAAGPIFGQLTRATWNAVWALMGCSIVDLKVATPEGTSDANCHPQDSCWAGGKHTLLPEESLRRSVSFGKLRSQIDWVTRECTCHYGGEDS